MRFSMVHSGAKFLFIWTSEARKQVIYFYDIMAGQAQDRHSHNKRKK